MRNSTTPNENFEQMEVGADSIDDDRDSATPETQLTNLLEAFEDCGQLSRTLIQEKQTLESNNETLRRQNEELRVKFESERKSNETLKNDYDRLRQQCETARKSAQEKDEQLKTLKDELSTRNQEIARLSGQVDSEKKRSFELIRKVETDCDNKVKRMKTDLNRSYEKLKLMTAREKESKSRASELEMKLALSDTLKLEPTPGRSPKTEPRFNTYVKEAPPIDYERLLSEERSRYDQKIQEFDSKLATLNSELTRVTNLLYAAEEREKELKKSSRIENEKLCDQKLNGLEERVRRLTEEVKSSFDREESCKSDVEKLRKENEELQNKIVLEKKASKHWHRKYEVEFNNNKKFYQKIKLMKQHVKDTVEATRNDMSFLRSKLDEIKNTVFSEVPKYFGDLNLIVEKTNVSLRKMHENHTFMVTRITGLAQKVANLQQEKENIPQAVARETIDKDTNTERTNFVEATTNTTLLEEQMKDLDPETTMQSLSDQCLGSIVHELSYLRSETCNCQRLVLESQNMLAKQREENETLELKIRTMKDEMERDFMAKIKTLLASH